MRFLTKVKADKACRVRGYINEGFKDSDIGRPTTEVPKGQHGVLFDVVLDTAPYEWQMSPVAMLPNENPVLLVTPAAAVDLVLA